MEKLGAPLMVIDGETMKTEFDTRAKNIEELLDKLGMINN